MTSAPIQRRGLWAGRVDALQALTGFCLALFVLLHFSVVSTVLISPDLMTRLEHFFESIWLTQIGLPGLFVVILLHFLLAARKMPFRARELSLFLQQAKMLRHVGTWIWLVQVATAIIILALFSIHLYEVQMSLPIKLGDTTARVARAGASCFYVLLLLATLSHALLGIFRVGVKYGWINRGTRRTAVRILWGIGAGYTVISLSALARLHSLA